MCIEPPLPFCVAMAAAGQFRHYPLGVHAGGEHMAMIAIGGDHLIAFADGHLHPRHHRLLADIEMAEAADEAHAVKLPRLLLKAADQQHEAIGSQFLLGGQLRRVRRGLTPAVFVEPEIGGTRVQGWRIHGCLVAWSSDSSETSTRRKAPESEPKSLMVSAKCRVSNNEGRTDFFETRPVAAPRDEGHISACGWSP